MFRPRAGSLRLLVDLLAKDDGDATSGREGGNGHAGDRGQEGAGVGEVAEVSVVVPPVVPVVAVVVPPWLPDGMVDSSTTMEKTERRSTVTVTVPSAATVAGMAFLGAVAVDDVDGGLGASVLGADAEGQRELGELDVALGDDLEGGQRVTPAGTLAAGWVSVTSM